MFKVPSVAVVEQRSVTVDSWVHHRSPSELGCPATCPWPARAGRQQADRRVQEAEDQRLAAESQRLNAEAQRLNAEARLAGAEQQISESEGGCMDPRGEVWVSTGCRTTEFWRNGKVLHIARVDEAR